jgi:hypothetical protein
LSLFSCLEGNLVVRIGSGQFATFSKLKLQSTSQQQVGGREGREGGGELEGELMERKGSRRRVEGDREASGEQTRREEREDRGGAKEAGREQTHFFFRERRSGFCLH